MAACAASVKAPIPPTLPACFKPLRKDSIEAAFKPFSTISSAASLEVCFATCLFNSVFPTDLARLSKKTPAKNLSSIPPTPPLITPAVLAAVSSAPNSLACL